MTTIAEPELAAVAFRRDFRRLLLANGINAGGDAMTATALTIAIFGADQSFALVAVLLACHTVPQMLWSGRAGRLADRSEARLLARRVLLALGALLVVLAAVPSWQWLTFALVAVIASVYTFADMSIFALIPQISGEDPIRRRKVNATMGTARWVGAALGALLAGWLTLRFNYRIPILIDAASYVIAAVLIGSLAVRRRSTVESTPDSEAEESTSDPTDAAPSRLMLLRRYPRVTIGIAVLCSSILFLGTSGVLLIGLVDHALHADAAFYGLAISLYSAGILGGTVIARVLAKRLRPMPTLLGACGANGLFMVLQAVLANRAATVGLQTTGGLAHGLDALSMRSLLMEETEDRLIGQFFSIFYAAAAGADLAAFVLGAVLGELLPVRWAFGLSGLAAVAVVVVSALLLRPARRKSSPSAG